MIVSEAVNGIQKIQIVPLIMKCDAVSLKFLQLNLNNKGKNYTLTHTYTVPF